MKQNGNCTFHTCCQARGARAEAGSWRGAWAGCRCAGVVADQDSGTAGSGEGVRVLKSAHVLSLFWTESQKDCRRPQCEELEKDESEDP